MFVIVDELTNRGQIVQVAQGLHYLHREGIIHGDLRGVCLPLVLLSLTLS